MRRLVKGSVNAVGVGVERAFVGVEHFRRGSPGELVAQVQRLALCQDRQLRFLGQVGALLDETRHVGLGFLNSPPGEGRRVLLGVQIGRTDGVKLPRRLELARQAAGSFCALVQREGHRARPFAFFGAAFFTAFAFAAFFAFFAMCLLLG